MSSSIAERRGVSSSCGAEREGLATIRSYLVFRVFLLQSGKILLYGMRCKLRKRVRICKRSYKDKMKFI